MAEFIKNRFWTVLPYRLVRDLSQLQLSPAAVKEERERKPRILCDHSWYPVNDSALPHAPPEAMQFGGTLGCLLHSTRHANPAFGPTYLSKYNIKDGFYCMFLRANDCPHLAIILPLYPGEEQLVTIPMSCIMGWVESPPTFCAMSEMVTDLMNRWFSTSPERPCPHRLDGAAGHADDWSSWDPDPAGAPSSNRPFLRPVGSTNVFVDNFIQLGQGSPSRLQSLRRHLLHSIDQVLSAPTSGEKRNEAVSLKKLLMGDGSWSTRKLMLGWILDTVRQTLELPPHRHAELTSIFADLSHAHRVSFKRWQQALGKLRFVSVAIPGSPGLFSTLQWAHNKANGNRVRVNRFVRDCLDSFGRLAADL
jgi:hypothetical protein